MPECLMSSIFSVNLPICLFNLGEQIHEETQLLLTTNSVEKYFLLFVLNLLPTSLIYLTFIVICS